MPPKATQTHAYKQISTRQSVCVSKRLMHMQGTSNTTVVLERWYLFVPYIVLHLSIVWWSEWPAALHWAWQGDPQARLVPHTFVMLITCVWSCLSLVGGVSHCLWNLQEYCLLLWLCSNYVSVCQEWRKNICVCKIFASNFSVTLGYVHTNMSCWASEAKPGHGAPPLSHSDVCCLDTQRDKACHV